MCEVKQELLSLVRPAGQEHLLAFWDELDGLSRQTLAAQIREIDFDLVARLYQQQHDATDLSQLAARGVSPSAYRLRASAEGITATEAKRHGQQALRQHRVAAILVAGGQGTRLGFPHPKGTYRLGPISDRSLFEIHVDRLRAVALTYGTRIPLYLMTSPATHEETVSFFEEHGRFGMPAEDLRLFCQGTMPSVAEVDGKLLLAERHQLSLNPDGHGGMLAALVSSGCLAEMQQRGIEHLFYFQVDNPLIAAADPEFLGYHILSESEMTTQVVAKQDPMDKVGNVIALDGRLHVIEYSDLPEDAARRRNRDGSLSIWAGSIAVHAMDISFLQRVSEQRDGLPFHRARKKVPHIASGGRRIAPETPNAIKFERFIFDLLPQARNATLVEVDIPDGFAPLKNASGADRDTAETTRAAMVAQHRRWLLAAGAKVAGDCLVEINPKFALDAEALAQRLEPGLHVEQDRYFQ